MTQYETLLTEKQNEFVITSLGNLCKPGDWIVKVDGECKIVKQEDFNKTYEVAE